MRVEFAHTRRKHWEKGNLYFWPVIRLRWHEETLLELLWLTFRVSLVWGADGASRSNRSAS